MDDCVDESPRARLVAALTEAVRIVLASGDGEGAKIALRALEEIARVTLTGKGSERIADLALVRGRLQAIGRPYALEDELGPSSPEVVVSAASETKSS